MKRVLLGVAVALLTCSGVIARDQDPTAQTVAAVAQWVEAVRGHTPGQADAAVDVIAHLTRDDRKTLNVGMPVFLTALSAKRPIVSGAAGKRVSDIANDQLRDFGMNGFLERAAILHGDAAMFGFKAMTVLPNAERPALSGSSVNPEKSPLLFDRYLPLENDGELVGSVLTDWNWVFARSLLDLVAPKHTDDAFVSAWYHATTSFMFFKRVFGEATPHLDHAAAMLPDDPRIMFDRACSTELVGLPRSQQALSDEDLAAMRLAARPGFKTSLARESDAAKASGARPAELSNAEAEMLFRRALALDSRLFDARVRLARLLTLRSRYAEALDVLRAAPAGSIPSDPAELFYAHLFTARAERGMGHLDSAARSAHEALLLFPDAQSALMASSQIAMLRADVEGAEAPMRQLAMLPADPDKRLDPWWLYDTFTGRDAKRLLTDMWAQARALLGSK